MIVLDTTVLVYAVGGDHDLAAPARRVIQSIASGDLTATTTVEVIQEFAHVRARRRPRGDAIELARAYSTLLAPLATTGAVDLERGFTLWEEHDSLGAFDAVVLAVSERLRATALVTADRGLLRITDVPVISLDDTDRLLG